MTIKNNEILIIREFNDDIASLLGALANDYRLILLTYLFEETKDFSELKEKVGLSKTALAHHLERLADEDLIRNVSRGRYELTEDGYDIIQVITKFYNESKRKKALATKKMSEKITKAYTQKNDSYENLTVNFKRLKKMRVVSFHAISKSPEMEAISKLTNWAEKNQIPIDNVNHPTFGFNNPSPTPGKDEYGYEIWLKVDSDFKSDDDEIVIKDIPGAYYAVTTSWQLSTISRDWKNLVRWAKEHEYDIRKDIPCLERAHVQGVSEDELVLDLYLPIKE